jgi:hypothetical protein
MADDGMLLNFAVGDQPWAPKTTAYTGGRWKDRLTAKKALQYGQNKSNPDYKKERPKLVNTSLHIPLAVSGPETATILLDSAQRKLFLLCSHTIPPQQPLLLNKKTNQKMQSPYSPPTPP